MTVSCLLAADLPLAATNQATGDVAGDAGALIDSNTFVLNSTGSRLPLVKRAFLSDGSPVSSPSTLPAGSVVKFLLYVNNDTAEPIHDLTVRDILDPAFAYQLSSIRIDNSVASCAAALCTPAEEAAIFTAVDAVAASSDGFDGDGAGYEAGTPTVHLGDGVQANAQVDMIADRVWAALFTVSLPSSFASTVNSATGGIAGLNDGSLDYGDGSGEAQRTLIASQLGLVKQARRLDGVVLADGSDVAPGQQIYFVLYVDNPTAFPAADLRVTDLLDESQFTYVDESLESTSVASGASDATLWAGPWTALDDAASGADEASAADTGGPAGDDRITWGAVAVQPNGSASAPGSTRAAIRFRVTVN